jgi:hypothetical protein
MEAEGLARPGEPLELLQEDAFGSAAMAAEYRLPTRDEPVFTLPMTFITKGWIHVLEDRELLVILMVACGVGGLDLGGHEVAIPGVVRVHNYGVSRDSFGASCTMLRELGLLEVEADPRHDDGRAVEFGMDDSRLSLTRLTLREEGFERDALDVVLPVLDSLLDA